MYEAAIYMGLIVGIPLMLLGTFILKLLARKVGKIANAAFLNTLLVVFIGCLGTFALLYISNSGYLVGQAIINGGMFFGAVVAIFLNAAAWAATYIPAGKYAWKTGWANSIKANMGWIVFCAATYGIILTWMTSKSGVIPQ